MHMKTFAKVDVILSPVYSLYKVHEFIILGVELVMAKRIAFILGLVGIK